MYRGVDEDDNDKEAHMPTAPRTACSTRGCPRYAAPGHHGRCIEHSRAQERRIGSSHERGYTRAWRVLSERIRRERPLCQQCETRGVYVPSADVHHIIAIEERPELRLVESNLLAVCRNCHNQRELRERSETGQQ